MTSAPPPSPPQPRNSLRSILLVGIPVLVIGALVTAVLVYANQPIDEIEPVGQPTLGASDPATTTPPTPTATRSFSTVPDTAGPAKGQVQVFTELLRAQGLACSDEHIDDRVVLSRGCYRTGQGHTVAAEFLATVDGTLGRVAIDVNYIGAPDATTSHADHDDLVRLFVRAAGIPEGDARTVLTRLAVDAKTFRIPWGGAELQRGSSASSSIVFRRAGWKYPLLTTATLPGRLAQVSSVATKRGYVCKDKAPTVECTRSLGPIEPGKEAIGKLKLVATERANQRALERLYVVADTGKTDAADQAVAEQTAVLDALGGPRAAALKQWFGINRGRANGRAYVAGLHAGVTAGDPKLLPGHVQFEVRSPCWPDAVGFC